jgi:hypothetical protein
MFINNINGCQPQANWCHPCLGMNEKYEHGDIFHWKLRWAMTSFMFYGGIVKGMLLDSSFAL